MVKYYSFILFIVVAFSTPAQSQSLDENINIIYMKANVLFDTQRYDEAVQLYNRVLNTDENFVQAYIMRGKAKYELGAYKGTKNDLMAYIDKAGITKEVVKIMAKVELKLKNFIAAENYLKSSLELDPYDAEQYLLYGGLALAMNDKNKACEQWSRGSNLGDKKSMELLDKYCDIFITVKLEDELQAAVSDTASQEFDTQSDIDTSGQYVVEDEPDRDAYQEIKIEEGLSVILGNGLGNRRVDYIPDIYLISEQSGRVVINICVDGKGDVLFSEFDKQRSTLTQAGLISLSLRKAKEFKFFPSFRMEQCGYLIFLLEES